MILNKKEGRIYFKAQRKNLSINDIHDHSNKIAQNIINEIFIEGRNVHIFLPIEHHKEINLKSLLTINNANFITSIANFNDFSLTHYLIDNKTTFELDEFKIPIPKSAKIFNDINKIDIVFVPLLAVDKLGKRIGYGKGFYDRFLSSLSSKCRVIGVSSFPPINKITDIEKYDISLDQLIIPDNIYYFT